MLKDDRVRAEMVRGAVPLRIVDRALIVTLPLHKDWVTQLVYVPGLGALLSGSLDSALYVTQLDWPPIQQFSSATAALDLPLIDADAGHCRNMCSIRAHAKGVISMQLIHIASRKMCATCSYERQVNVWNIETGDLLKVLEGHRGLLRQLAFDSHSLSLLSLGVDGELRVWDMNSYACLQTMRAQNVLDRISSIAYNAHQHSLVTTTRRLALWQHPRKTATDAVLNATLLAPQGHQHPLVAVLYSYHFYLVVTGDESGSVCVWDVRSGAQVFRFEHGSRLTAMELDHTGRKLITGGVDGRVILWNFSSGEPLKTVSTEAAPTTEVASLAHVQLAKLSYYVAVGWSRDVWMWPNDANTNPRRLPGHTDDVLSVAFCPPNLLITGAYNGVILVHNCDSLALQRRVQVGGGATAAADEAPPLDGPPTRRAAAATPSSANPSSHGSAELDDLSRWAARAEPTAAPGVGFFRSVAIESLAILDPQRRVMPDSVLVSGGADGYMRLWSVHVMALLVEMHVCESPTDGLQHVVAEGSATILAFGDSAGRISVWDVSTLPQSWPNNAEMAARQEGVPLLPASVVRPLYAWRAHSHAITRLAYMTGIEGLISASSDCTVRMWTLSGEQIGIFGQVRRHACLPMH